MASTTDIPEPPGLYWEALRRNVSRRIAEEPPRRVRWGWLVPVAATAGALVVTFSLLERPLAPTAPPTLPAWSALPPVDEDPDLFVVSGFAIGEEALIEWEEGQGLGAFVASLSDEDSAALVEALGVEQIGGEL
jgi:hypothetical protein